MFVHGVSVWGYLHGLEDDFRRPVADDETGVLGFDVECDYIYKLKVTRVSESWTI